MSYLDKYINRNSMYGDGLRDIRINNTKRKIESSLKDSPSYYEITIDSSPTLYGVQIVDDSQVRDEKILSVPYETPILSGSVITWKSEKWLVIHFDEMSEIYKRCKLKKSPSFLVWQDENGIQKEAFFAYNTDSISNFGIDEGRIIELGNERRNILIPSNLDTRKIKKDKRFIIDERAWKVISVDRLSKQGLINLVLKEDEINEATDNLELRIADYYNNIANYTLEITNGDSISINSGNTVQLNVVVKNNGVVIDNPSISYSTSDDLIATVDSAGIVSGVSDGTANITASLTSDSSVKDTISITITTVVVDNFSIEITGVPEIKNGQSKLFSAVIYNNGTQVAENVTWQLFADDQATPTTIASIASQTGTSCTIKNNAANSGYVQLKTTLARDNTVIAWLRIQMKPLF